MTWSPFFRLFTPGPASTTTPAPSCPRMDGKSPSGSAPESVYSSVWQMPVAIIWTSTSPAFGPSSRTVSMASGAPALCATAARTSMTAPRYLLLLFGVVQMLLWQKGAGASDVEPRETLTTEDTEDAEEEQEQKTFEG